MGRWIFRSFFIDASSSGVIRSSLYIDYSDVKVDGIRNSRIEDIEFRNGRIEFRVGYGRINGITRLSLPDSGIYIDLDTRGISSSGRFEGSQVNDFLYELVEEVRRYGDVTVYIDGTATSLAEFNLDFIINVNAYIRE